MLQYMQRLALLGCWCSFMLLNCQQSGNELSGTIGKFTPPEGKTLFIVGQDLGTVAGYKAHFETEPGGVTTYTDISENTNPKLLHGLNETVSWGAGDINAQECLDDYPQSTLAIGLYLVDNGAANLENIANGKHDDTITRLGTFIKDAERPVFLRIGYEFDGTWNHYEPDLYIVAFRHIVDRLRQQGVDNFATVWQSATYALGTYKNLPFTAWFPGDDYVDWMGTSYFVFDSTAHSNFLNFAREHGKPIMIAEAAPQGYDLDELNYSSPMDGRSFKDMSAAEIWAAWFSPFFDYIHRNADIVRAVAYINTDWNSQPMWKVESNNGYWGDSRTQINAEIAAKWQEEIYSDFWLHGSADLFATLSSQE